MTALDSVTWPAARLGEALGVLARHERLAEREGEPGPPPPGTPAGQLGPWLETATAWLGLEAEPVEVLYPDADRLIVGAGPALLRLPGAEERFLVLLRGRGRAARVLSPERQVVDLPSESVRVPLCAAVETSQLGKVDDLMAAAGVPPTRRARSRQALLRQLLARTPVGDCWLLRPAEAAGIAPQARQFGLPWLLAGLLGASLAEYLAWLLSWGLLGWMALHGRVDYGWLLAWFLLLLAIVPLRVGAAASAGWLALRGGALLKRRLLAGALRLDAEEVRHLGAGQLLGRVVESEALETSVLTGGSLGVTACLELLAVTFVLGAGAGGLLHVALLAATALAAALLAVRYYRRRSRWTEARLAMTNDLVERLVGHRTRLAQEPRERWNEGEDQELERYLQLSAEVDGAARALLVLLPRGWFLLGLVGLAPAFVAGTASTTALAVGLGGVLLAYRSFRSLAEGTERLTAAAVAWQRVRLFWQAAARREPPGEPGLAGRAAADAPAGATPVLDARGLAFHYPGRSGNVLAGVSLRIQAGDRLLLEGPSGQGKSTLANLLSGARTPSAGLVLQRGLDRETLGAAGWRRRVVLVPQFHENHVLIGPLAFNLLLGRAWPPAPEDLDEATRVCQELGLGPLLDRMPTGLMQQVGETGWQLSHGEKSRLYLARALLQGGDLFLLDESFGALDPENLRLSLSATLRRPCAVLVIAHP